MVTVAARLADLTSEMMLTPAAVTAVDRLSPQFLAVTLESDRFRRNAWSPGAKLQFRPVRGTMSLRTYTPVHRDADKGSTRLIAFTHGDGPGSSWFRNVQIGDTCEVFGPRKSIDLTAVAGRAVFIGDESGVGLACALHALGTVVSYVFEAADPAELTEVLAGQGLNGVTVVARGHGPLLTAARAAAGTDPFDLVVTGDAQTVHALRRDSREWPQPPSRVHGKAYWAAGRTGLD